MPGDITELLLSLRAGRPDAMDDLMPIVYEQLRAMARRKLGPRRGGETLDTSDLVHEAYLRLFDQSRVTPQDRRHFFALAARAMRRILIDHARRRGAAKRGGGRRRVDLDAAEVPAHEAGADLIAVDEALTRLAAVDERLAKVVELRFFGGLSVEETAEVVGVDPRTVKRDWRKARALLYRDLGSTGAA
jgi:RNA polymerase sigma factor (TIGR02999 family)